MNEQVTLADLMLFAFIEKAMQVTIYTLKK